ncbi:LapA family protein [Roseivirga misakiensis]|uniref:DUF4381 domain-containing protein n=1 Tax=Roseivirga misakiensis TaxID=1563681 RepID=A0A1E5SKM7_9BACT|nr:LapA family protein [Roseivirga misakiensis]OEJ99679.1 hypothetical protein BFP71_08910 [Roseivirga misakiensis]
MIRRFFGLLVLVTVLISAAHGQDNKPYGYFLKDSVKIGESVVYSLSYKDRKNRKVIFPDSLFDFSPFELLGKDYFDTESDSINSIDSAVYRLATFEIDTVQRLSLPVFLDTGSDSLELFSDIDSIILNQVVTIMPDSVSMAETSAYQPTSLQFNYPYWVVGLVTLGFITLVVLIVWGKELKKRIKLYRLKKQLAKFKLEFDQEIEHLNADTSKMKIESVLKFWKSYMEKLEKIPYTKLTTKELVSIQENGSLEETLKSIDKNIYSPVEVTALQNDFEFLKDYSEDRYNHVTEGIKNA